MMQKRYLLVDVGIICLLGLLFGASCSSKKGRPGHQEAIYKLRNYNILIAPDLSNRTNNSIHPKPVNDTILIDEIISNIPKILKSGHRQSGQQDIYKLDFINRGILNTNVIDPRSLEINLMKFKDNPLQRSNYIRYTLSKDINLFKTEVGKIYRYSLTNSAGADIWNYFNETINNSLRRYDRDTAVTIDKVVTEFKNIVVLFTDGYIETVNSTVGYKLNEGLINRIRSDFKVSQSQGLKEFILSKPGYWLKKTDNRLTGLSVLVFELVDRSLDRDGVALKHPTDFQIMKILWEHWLIQSGCEKVEVYPAVKTKEEVVERFFTFLSEVKF